MTDTNADRIRELNYAFRQTLLVGRVVMTAGIAAIVAEVRAVIVRRVQFFNAFDENNDPYDEHDFGSFDEHGHKVYWKIDCYDSTMTYGSEDAADPSQTTRVLTIMLAEEY